MVINNPYDEVVVKSFALAACLKANQEAESIIGRTLDESVSVYEFIKSQFEEGEVSSNYIFHFLFRSFYRMDNAGLSDKFKAAYFRVFDVCRNGADLLIINEMLKEYKDIQDREMLQFSFITKLLHTLDNSKPIYDSMVANVFGFKYPNYKDRSKRFEELSKQYLLLTNIYCYIIDNNLLGNLFDDFKKKFPASSASPQKIIDFIFWRVGKNAKDVQSKSRKEQRRIKQRTLLSKL